MRLSQSLPRDYKEMKNRSNSDYIANLHFPDTFFPVFFFSSVSSGLRSMSSENNAAVREVLRALISKVCLFDTNCNFLW